MEGNKTFKVEVGEQIEETELSKPSIELPDGVIEHLDLKIGDQIQFVETNGQVFIEKI